MTVQQFVLANKMNQISASIGWLNPPETSDHDIEKLESEVGSGGRMNVYHKLYVPQYMYYVTLAVSGVFPSHRTT